MKTIDMQSDPNVQPARQVPSVTSPAAPHPLDGSQFHNVIEEQVYSELPPTAEEQMPRRARNLRDNEAPPPHPDDPAISVGES